MPSVRITGLGTEIEFPGVGDYLELDHATSGSRKAAIGARLAQAQAILADALCVNEDSGMALTRATSAWNPWTLTTAPSGARRRVPFAIGQKMFSGDIVERVATNLLLQSGDTSNAAWTLADFTATANARMQPDQQNQTAALLTVNSTPTLPRLSQTVTISAANRVILSAYIVASATNVPFIRIRFSSDTDANGAQAWIRTSDWTVQTTGAFGTGTFTRAECIPPATGERFARIFISGKVAAAATSVRCILDAVASDNSSSPATAAQTLCATWLQCEAIDPTNASGADEASTYVATAGTTVTRNKDQLTWTPSATFGTVFNASGTLMALYKTKDYGRGGQIFRGGNFDWRFTNNSIKGSSYTGSVSIPNATFATQGMNVIATTWSAATVTDYLNGVQQSTGAAPSNGNYSSSSGAINLGWYDATFFDAKGAYCVLVWPRALSASEILLLAKIGGVA